MGPVHVGSTDARCSDRALPSVPPPPISWITSGVLEEAQAHPIPSASLMR